MAVCGQHKHVPFQASSLSLSAASPHTPDSVCQGRGQQPWGKLELYRKKKICAFLKSAHLLEKIRVPLSMLLSLPISAVNSLSRETLPVGRYGFAKTRTAGCCATVKSRAAAQSASLGIAAARLSPWFW